MDRKTLIHYRDLRRKLEDLRPLFVSRRLASTQPGYLRHFDQSLDANEYEVALHALIDFLLEPATDPISQDAITEISDVHSLMGLNDDCVNRLKQRIKE